MAEQKKGTTTTTSHWLMALGNICICPNLLFVTSNPTPILVALLIATAFEYSVLRDLSLVIPLLHFAWLIIQFQYISPHVPMESIVFSTVQLILCCVEVCVSLWVFIGVERNRQPDGAIRTSVKVFSLFLSLVIVNPQIEFLGNTIDQTFGSSIRLGLYLVMYYGLYYHKQNEGKDQDASWDYYWISTLYFTNTILMSAFSILRLFAICLVGFRLYLGSTKSSFVVSKRLTRKPRLASAPITTAPAILSRQVFMDDVVYNALTKQTKQNEDLAFKMGRDFKLLSNEQAMKDAERFKV